MAEFIRYVIDHDRYGSMSVHHDLRSAVELLLKTRPGGTLTVTHDDLLIDHDGYEVGYVVYSRDEILR